MRTIVMFTLCFMLGAFRVFAQSPVEVTPITNGYTVSFTLPSYTIRDTTLADLYTTEVFKYIKVKDFGYVDDVGYPQLPQFSFDLHISKGASNFTVTSSSLVTQVIPLNRRIVPSQDDFDALPAQPPTFQLNSAYYASNGSLHIFNGVDEKPEMRQIVVEH